MARSMMISIAARIHEKVLMLIHFPTYSPVQPSQKKDIGVHWNIMENVFAAPKQTTKVEMPMAHLRNKVESKTRR